MSEDKKPDLKVISFNKKALPKEEEPSVENDVDKVLSNCMGKYKEVIVIGWEPNDELKLITTSKLQIAEATLMLELAKMSLIDSMFEEEYE